MADRIADPWGERTPYGTGEPWPERVDLPLENGLTEADVERWGPTASVLHSNGDGYDFAVNDDEMLELVEACEQETAIQLKWLRTRMKQAAPQALVVT